MYCHYGPKVKLYCFCDKDERRLIEFVDYPKKKKYRLRGRSSETAKAHRG
eukprot:TRINITY_DN1494_c0_g1_i1.p3 TRINITY_DN1494_c0_g1~~TRINITY_DN1494_c0_g1_i1.p3  ORF type:complete len:50 (+),score=28.46 TRINITY_DN1494_c0_g1_i1:404-553(+)